MAAGSDVRIVLLGKTGVGKSASGNTILGTEEFVELFSPESVTSQCRRFETEVSGRTVMVVDTPGLFDTKLTNEQMKKEIVKCVYMTVPGPHVFLLVIRLGARFTEEDQNTMKWIRESFSELALKYALVLFTGFDDNVDLEDYIEQSSALKELISKCQGFHAFDNKNKNRSQVTKLLTKIDRMVKANGGQHYTDRMYKEAQRKIQEEEERKVREEEMKRQEEERKREEEQREKVEAMRRELEGKREEERKEDKKREEEKERKREEERKNDKKREEEKERKREEERKEEKKRLEELERKREEERKFKEEEERKREEEHREKVEELERKREEERKEDNKREEERERKREEERKEEKKRLEDLERKREEERKEDKKREEERERKREEERKEEKKRLEELERKREEERKEDKKREEERERKREEERKEEKKRLEELERKIEEEKKRQENNNPLAILGKVALTVPAFIGGTAVGLVESVVDVPRGMWNGMEEAALEANGKPGVGDIIGGEVKGLVGEVAKAPQKVFGRAFDGVSSLWK